MQTSEAQKNTENHMPGGGFNVVAGKTTYTVSVFFNKSIKTSLDEKHKKLIRNDVKNENF